MGKSPRHAGNTYLVLDLFTGLVSPQFHCSFDNFFESVTEANSNFINIDEWQFKAKFRKGGRKRIVHRNKTVEEDENDDNGHQSEPSYAEVIQQPSTSIEFEQPPNENHQEDIDRDSDDGFTPVHSSRPRRANAGQGVNRLNISPFKGPLQRKVVSAGGTRGRLH